MLEVVLDGSDGAPGPRRRVLPLAGRLDGRTGDDLGAAPGLRRGVLLLAVLVALSAGCAPLGGLPGELQGELQDAPPGQLPGGRPAASTPAMSPIGSSPDASSELTSDLTGSGSEAAAVRSDLAPAVIMAADLVSTAIESGSPRTDNTSSVQPAETGTTGAAVVLATATDPTFVLVQPQTFTMGSPQNEPGRWSDETQHQVTLTHSFYMQTTEVTQSQWKAIVGNNPSFNKDAGGTAPVETISWWEAAAYANALSTSEGMPKCYSLTGCSALPGTGLRCADVAVNAVGGDPYECAGYRLPTEAEWECAYRAGSTTAFYSGQITQTGFEPVDPNLIAIGWYSGNSGGTIRSVAQKQPNALGLYDVAGNVWEWTWDWLGPAYGGAAETDPLGPPDGLYRVGRGGSFSSAALHQRAAARGGARPDGRGHDLGFRLARSRF